MKQFSIAATTAGTITVIAAVPALAQNDVQVLSNWSYDPLYTEGWSVENMFNRTDILDASGEDIGDVENVIFDTNGEILGIIAQVGGFWDIGDTHVHVPWDAVTIIDGIAQIQVPVTEENVDDYNVFDIFGDEPDEERITQADTSSVAVVDDDLVAGVGVFKATDLIGDYAYLSDGERYGYIADIIVSDGTISAIVSNAAADGRRGYYAYPYGGQGFVMPNGPRYDMQYDATEVDTIENFDYNQLQSRVP